MRFTAALALLSIVGCSGCRGTLVSWFSPSYEAPAADEAAAAEVSGVELRLVLDGLAQPTDMQFEPGAPQRGLLLEKGGALKRFDLKTRSVKLVHQFEVISDSEMGLLGLAFHPDYPRDRRVFINRNIQRGAEQLTRIASFEYASGQLDKRSEIVLFDVVQPYPNHNAGQLSFGLDGYLYVGFGDGGWRDDPGKHGQNKGTLLGTIARIDVAGSSPQKPYAIPTDNPFVGEAGARPEVFVYGVRNPWKFSFAPDGRLIVADVGQDKWEEVSLVKSGDNLGWDRTEGNNCFSKSGDCNLSDYAPAFVQYGHDLGRSITGGYVHRGPALAAHKGRYVFGDFVTGRVWSAALPAQVGAVSELTLIGEFGRLIASFAQGADGALYLLDFAKGQVLRFDDAA